MIYSWFHNLLVSELRNLYGCEKPDQVISFTSGFNLALCYICKKSTEKFIVAIVRSQQVFKGECKILFLVDL